MVSFHLMPLQSWLLFEVLYQGEPYIHERAEEVKDYVQTTDFKLNMN